MPAKVDHEKCEGCGDCVDACGTGAIVMENEKAKVDGEQCCDCNACVDQCQSKAIEIID